MSGLDRLPVNTATFELELHGNSATAIIGATVVSGYYLWKISYSKELMKVICDTVREVTGAYVTSIARGGSIVLTVFAESLRIAQNVEEACGTEFLWKKVNDRVRAYSETYGNHVGQFESIKVLSRTDVPTTEDSLIVRKEMAENNLLDSISMGLKPHNTTMSDTISITASTQATNKPTAPTGQSVTVCHKNTSEADTMPIVKSKPAPVKEQKSMSVGIFYHPDDQKIAERLKQKTLDRFELVINLFDEGIPAGKPLPVHCLDFIDSYNSLWWIATEKSMENKYSSFYMVKLLDESIRDRQKHFTLVAPEEYLGMKPRRELQHLQPLKENSNFIKQLESTFKWIESRQKNAKIPSKHPSVKKQQISLVDTKIGEANITYNVENVGVINISG